MPDGRHVTVWPIKEMMGGQGGGQIFTGLRADFKDEFRGNTLDSKEFKFRDGYYHTKRGAWISNKGLAGVKHVRRGVGQATGDLLNWVERQTR